MNSVVMSDRARDFARECHIDLDYAVASDEPSFPMLMPLDDHGRPLLHVSEPGGVDYYLSKIDYFQSDFRVAGSRLVSMILPGYRSRSSYITADQAKEVGVHNGYGYLVIGSAPDEDNDFATEIYPLTPGVTPSVTIPTDHFYTFEAASWSHEPFIVSELTSPPHLSTSSDEIGVSVDQTSIVTSDGREIPVPEEFQTGEFH